ncbi:hypothetical protein D3C81_1799770 [compost metagenome]
MRVAVAVDVSMQDATAPLWLQLFKAMVDARRMRVGVEVGIVRSGFVGLAERRFPAVITQQIQRQMPGHAEHPATRRTARRVKPRRAVPDLDEGLMNNVLRQRRIAHQALGHAEQTRAFLHIQIAQGRTLATGTGSEMGFVIENGFG